jgi:hypothetical protein
MILEPNKVYTFKLTSGEELIAKVISTSQPWLMIETPVSVAPAPQGMGLVPSSFTADPKQTIQLNINTVALCAPTDESVCNKYLEATTGIKVPDKKILVG